MSALLPAVQVLLAELMVWLRHDLNWKVKNKITVSRNKTSNWRVFLEKSRLYHHEVTQAAVHLSGRSRVSTDRYTATPPVGQK